MKVGSFRRILAAVVFTAASVDAANQAIDDDGSSLMAPIIEVEDATKLGEVGPTDLDLIKLKSLEKWASDRLTKLEEERDLAVKLEAGNLQSTVELNLGRLMETADAIAAYASLLESSNATHLPFHDVLQASSLQVNKTKDITIAIFNALEEESASSRYFDDHTTSGTSQSRRLEEEEVTVKSTKKHRHANNPKVKKVARVHDALQAGDFSFAEKRFDKFHNSHSLSKGKDISAHRRLDEESNSTSDHEATVLRAEEDCLRLIGCVEEWTMYDLIAYFFFDDITEDGAINSQFWNLETDVGIAGKAEEIQMALKGFAREEPEYIGCFKDAGIRAMPVAKGSGYTIESCIETCGKEGYQFAGLQFYSQCRCADTADEYAKYGQVDDSICSFACSVDGVGNCGGSYKNSVWSTVGEVVPANTQSFHPKCNGLLRLFHRNLEQNFTEGGYQQHIPATWRDICRSEGNTRYIKFSEIEEKLGDDIADRVFEDALHCANRLQPDAFFGNSNQPRLPVGIDTSSLDLHGKLMDQSGVWEFENLGVSDSLHPVNSVWSSKTAFYTNFKSKMATSCGSGLNSLYKQEFESISPYFAEDARYTYSTASVKCYLTGWSTSGGSMYCSMSVEGYSFSCGFTCSSCWYRTSSIFTDKFELTGLFQNAGNRDLTLEALLGPSVSNGLLCAHQTPPGFCCLDLPGQNTGFESWGQEFDCSQGESKCHNLGPLLSGFSEESCDVYSGVYCAYPRDCSTLQLCIADEIEWATENEKKAYLEYLEGVDPIEDPTDDVFCGEVREYFGFDAEYPLDDEICEDIALLRYKREFESLDAFAAADEPPDAPEIEASTRPPKGVAEILEDFGDLTPSAEGPRSEDYHTKIPRLLSMFEHVVETYQEAYDFCSDFDCPGGAISSSICKIAKNIASVLSLIILFIGKRLLQATLFSYDENDCLSNFNMREIYETIMVQEVNVGVLYDGIVAMGALNTANTEVLIEEHYLQNEVLENNFGEVFGQFTYQTGVIFPWIGDRFGNVDSALQKRFDNVDKAYENLYDLIEEKLGASATSRTVDTFSVTCGEGTVSVSTDEGNECVTTFSCGNNTTPVSSGSVFECVSTVSCGEGTLEEVSDSGTVCVSDGDSDSSTGRRRLLESTGSSGRRGFKTRKMPRPEVAPLVGRNAPRLEAPPALGYRYGRVVGQSFKNISQALEFLGGTLSVDGCSSSKPDIRLTLSTETDCEAVVEAKPACVQETNGPREAGHTQQFSVKMDKTPPQLSAGFAADNRKTLVAEEGQGYIDAGLVVSSMDACSKAVNVEVTVLSNEFENDPMAVITKTVNPENGTEKPNIFLSTNRCQTSGADKFCVSKTAQDNTMSSSYRVYTLKVKATDEAGWISEDTCHVIIVPKSGTGGERELRGKASLDYSSQLEEEVLAAKPTEQFSVGRLSLKVSN